GRSSSGPTLSSRCCIPLPAGARARTARGGCSWPRHCRGGRPWPRRDRLQTALLHTCESSIPSFEFGETRAHEFGRSPARGGTERARCDGFHCGAGLSPPFAGPKDYSGEASGSFRVKAMPPTEDPLTLESPLLSDLHRHLDGSLRPATVAELAARAGVAVPADLAFVPGIGL